MSRALNTTTGQLVDGDLVEILGEEFRDWRARGTTTLGGWEINPTSDRIAAIQTVVAATPEAMAANRAAKIAAIKANAAEEIVSQWPIWKQINNCGAMIERLGKVIGVIDHYQESPQLNDEDKSAIRDVLAMWKEVKAIRAASDEAEKAL